ncbi:MAG: hypothetical protein Q8P10_00120 [bacterium]|nr:hypothetical protein [bacterium]
MKIIVTHSSPDLDAIASVWFIKKFLQGWEDAEVKFVPAGERYSKLVSSSRTSILISDPIEKINDDEVVHVDTGLGPFDHHLTSDENISATSLVWEYIKESQKLKVKSQNEEESEKWKDREEAVDRMVKVVTDIDHFKEVFWENPLGNYHDFSLVAILEGLKFQKPNQDEYYVEFIASCLDAILHAFENRVWAEKEISEKGHEFATRFGKALAIETINDSVLKLGQKMGYVIVLRKDPRKGYVRIKALPSDNKQQSTNNNQQTAATDHQEIDLTLAYEKLKKMDPEATWFLHVSKKMLLNGTTKNPKMKASTLSLEQIIKVLEVI